MTVKSGMYEVKLKKGECTFEEEVFIKISQGRLNTDRQSNC
jgi:hypothetical protein